MSPERSEQAKYARRLIEDINVLEAKRNLAVYELDARMVARWLLAAVSFTPDQPKGGKVMLAKLIPVWLWTKRCPGHCGDESPSHDSHLTWLGRKALGI